MISFSCLGSSLPLSLQLVLLSVYKYIWYASATFFCIFIVLCMLVWCFFLNCVLHHKFLLKLSNWLLNPVILFFISKIFISFFFITFYFLLGFSSLPCLLIPWTYGTVIFQPMSDNSIISYVLFSSICFPFFFHFTILQICWDFG